MWEIRTTTILNFSPTLHAVITSEYGGAIRIEF